MWSFAFFPKRMIVHMLHWKVAEIIKKDKKQNAMEKKNIFYNSQLNFVENFVCTV